MNKLRKNLALIILDGFGHNPNTKHNAIAAANTPCIDTLMNEFPFTLIDASQNAVGLEKNQMGNSEVGHMTIGAGRILTQDISRINKAIKNKTFFNHKKLCKSFEEASNNKTNIHIIGLLSDGGVHGHISQIQASIDLALKYSSNVHLHAILDGRDTAPKSAKRFINKIENDYPNILSSITGRYYAMDRDCRWDRTYKTYSMLTNPQPEIETLCATDILECSYKREVTDEFILPTRVKNFKPINDNDIVIFMNYRSDRSKQLSLALLHGLDKNNTEPKFKSNKKVNLFTLTNYGEEINSEVLFKPLIPSNTLSEILSQHNLKQLKIAETEKYAHVTFFINGGVEKPYNGEDRILVPSPKVSSYDNCPQMSAYQITGKIIASIQDKKYDLIICNFANADMVGHTGNFEATVKAIEVLDNCLKSIIKSLKENGGAALITADHGNAEKMYNTETNQKHTAHTLFPVPLIYTENNVKFIDNGGLADIAPTILKLLKIEKPKEMTGKALLNFIDNQ